MEKAEQIQRQATPPTVLHRAVKKAQHRTGTHGRMAMTPLGRAETSGQAQPEGRGVADPIAGPSLLLTSGMAMWTARLRPVGGNKIRV
jgi:hypothetical protein